ncbi:MAG: DUF2971 domain-containing protein [Bacteroidota bacterium]
MDNVKLISELKLPPTLFKYRYYRDSDKEKLVSQSVKSLLNNQIFIPSADTFNDPYDSAIPFRYNPNDLTEENIFKKCLELAKYKYPDATDTEVHKYAFDNQQKGLLNNPDHIDEFDRLNFEKSCRDFGIFCVTEDSLNTLMWSYYADSHKGICVGYNTEKLVSSELFGMGGKVIYRDDFPYIPLFPDERHHHFLDLFYTKWTVWEHENEYRLLHTYRNGKVHNIDSEIISEVILGFRFKEEDKLLFVQQLLNTFPKVKIYEISLNKDKFELKKKLIVDGSLLLNFR